MNPLYLIIAHGNESIEEKNENKYLIFDSTDENRELLKNTMMFGMELKKKSKKWAVVSVIIKKITWKLNLILKITYP